MRSAEGRGIETEIFQSPSVPRSPWSASTVLTVHPTGTARQAARLAATATATRGEGRRAHAPRLAIGSWALRAHPRDASPVTADHAASSDPCR